MPLQSDAELRHQPPAQPCPGSDRGSSGRGFTVSLQPTLPEPACSSWPGSYWLPPAVGLVEKPNQLKGSSQSTDVQSQRRSGHGTGSAPAACAGSQHLQWRSIRCLGAVDGAQRGWSRSGLRRSPPLHPVQELGCELGYGRVGPALPKAAAALAAGKQAVEKGGRDVEPNEKQIKPEREWLYVGLNAFSKMESKHTTQVPTTWCKINRALF